MSEKRWTDRQLQFIEAKRGPILVSAAAGSGKTAAIVERISRRLCDEQNPLLPSRLLMTTFSVAAADEMKSRIEEMLQKRLDGDPDNLKLQNQIEQMQEASISTIHSLCFKIIRENFSHLNLFCDFKVADDTEKLTLMQSAMDRVIRRAYDNNSPDFYKLIELVCNSRSDYELSGVILKLYETVIAMPFPEDVLKQWLLNFEGSEQSYLKWSGALLVHCKKYVDFVLEIAYKNAKEVPDLEKIAFARSDLQLARDLKDAYDAGDCQKLGEISCAAAASGGFVTFSGKMEPELKEKLKQRRESLKKAVKELSEMLSYVGKDSYIADQNYTYPAIKMLFELTLEFIEEFASEKKDRNVLDFSDAEQFSLRLLWQKNSSGQYEITPIAKQIKGRFDEIYIDEYQDVNKAQQMIFEAIVPENQNIFMVGDVKQSIYAFRQADAEIFEDKKQSYFDFDGENFPAKIFFDSNFRSRSGITDFVNQIFSKIMTPQSCCSSYGENDYLKAGAQYFENENSGVEFLFYESEPKTREKAWLADEARVVAAEIKRLVDSKYPVRDTDDNQRPCRYSDFCIMLRSDSGRFSVYAKALEDVGIESELGSANIGFFESREILMVLSILKAINNPYDDIALCAAMMSPVFMFEPSELATIKGGQNRKMTLFDAVKSASQKGELKCIDFEKKLKTLRRLASAQSVDSLLYILYEKYGLYHMVGAMQNGEIRMDNLDSLRHYSRTFEKNGYKGLSDFLRFLNKIQNSDIDLTPAQKASEKNNSVSIMTIHKSKGLEFPICILANGFGAFNSKDLYSRILINKNLGFASVITDEKNAVSYSPLTYRILQLEAEQSQTAEEMRILYVALTRAKEKLIIPIVRSDIGSSISAAQMQADLENTCYSICKAKSYAKWVLFACADGRSFEAAAKVFDCESLQTNPDSGFSTRIASEIKDDAVYKQNVEERIESDSELILKMKEAARFDYPFKMQSQIPSKYSVSELSKSSSEGVFDFDSAPDFMCENEMSGAARGTALHTFMQFANFERAAQNLQLELDAVCEKGHITPQQKDAIELSRLSSFFESSLFKRILKADSVFREYKFTVGVDSGQFGGSRYADDTVVLQGIADCVIIEGNCATIIDYKTDYVKTPNELLERYSMQLSIYKSAIEKMLSIPVKQCLIYSFCLSCEIEVETEQNFI